MPLRSVIGGFGGLRWWGEVAAEAWQRSAGGGGDTNG